MAGKHRLELAAAELSWRGDLSEPSGRDWFTPVVESEIPGWPKRDVDAEIARLRVEGSRVATNGTPFSTDMLAVLLDGVARI